MGVIENAVETGAITSQIIVDLAQQLGDKVGGNHRRRKAKGNHCDWAEMR